MASQYQELSMRTGNENRTMHRDDVPVRAPLRDRALGYFPNALRHRGDKGGMDKVVRPKRTLFQKRGGWFRWMIMDDLDCVMASGEEKSRRMAADAARLKRAELLASTLTT